MKKHSVCRFFVLAFCLVAFSYTISRANMVKRLPMSRKPTILKVKTYQNDTIMLVWIDMNGDGKCDVAYLYEKNDGYFIENRFTCEQADECDAFIFEPRV